MANPTATSNPTSYGRLNRDDNATPVGWTYGNITTTTTTTIKASPGMLHCITINTPSGSAVVTVYDNTAGSGTKIATMTMVAGQPSVTLQYDLVFSTGLTIVTSVNPVDLTVTYI